VKLSDFYHEAILWTCYLENFPDPERYLNIYNLSMNDRLMFEHLGNFFPFDEFYAQCPENGRAGGMSSLTLSKKLFILPWIYWPRTSSDSLCGKQIISPSARLFTWLDNKIEAKKLFEKLGIPTPAWGFSSNGTPMLEKPIQNSAGGLGIRLTPSEPQAGCFLETWLPGYQSIGIQLFVYDEVEFVCADQMLFDYGDAVTFTFHGQRNVMINELAATLIEDCFRLGGHLQREGYRGFVGLDALVKGEHYYLIEINPRGIAFLPAYFAATARGWNSFETYSKRETLEKDEMLLLDFGSSRKVVRKLS
jgi:hypothetical protein